MEHLTPCLGHLGLTLTIFDLHSFLKELQRTRWSRLSTRPGIRIGSRHFPKMAKKERQLRLIVASGKRKAEETATGGKKLKGGDDTLSSAEAVKNAKDQLKKLQKKKKVEEEEEDEEEEPARAPRTPTCLCS
eukprot:Skav202761  [mRNA]  locus=scaffold326:136462:139512:+ [translate_table: standard]